MRTAFGGPGDLLIDTNVLVYLHDPRDRGKQQRAASVVEQLMASGRAALSMQCLSEFYRVSTQRLPEPLTPADALAEVERLVAGCEVFDLTPAAIVEGTRIAVRRQLSIWDALIWAVARLNGVPYVLTEDAEHGSTLEGVSFVNPFADGFDAEAVGLTV